MRVQLRTNAKSMPIEDASAEWPESESQYLPVARDHRPAAARVERGARLAGGRRPGVQPLARPAGAPAAGVRQPRPAALLRRGRRLPRGPQPLPDPGAAVGAGPVGPAGAGLWRTRAARAAGPARVRAGRRAPVVAAVMRGDRGPSLIAEGAGRVPGGQAGALGGGSRRSDAGLGRPGAALVADPARSRRHGCRPGWDGVTGGRTIGRRCGVGAGGDAGPARHDPLSRACTCSFSLGVLLSVSADASTPGTVQPVGAHMPPPRIMPWLFHWAERGSVMGLTCQPLPSVDISWPIPPCARRATPDGNLRNDGASVVMTLPRPSRRMRNRHAADGRALCWPSIKVRAKVENPAKAC